MKIEKPVCDCVKKLDKILEEHNTKVSTNLFNTSQVLIETYKIDTKKRGKAKSVIAAYCPFCGKKLP